jgi:hypothetical protein
MAVVEFADASGRRWRAWDINPESIHPQTKAEDYLADCFQSGWIVFETLDGADKRRLCPPPRGWDTFDESGLQRLLLEADRIPLPKRARERNPDAEASGATPRWDRRADDAATQPQSGVADLTDLRVVRSFHYPGGRVWTASLAPSSTGSGTPVLRFSAGARHLDLARWPRDWPDYPDERLMDLLRSAEPRKPGSIPPAGLTGRRHTDPRP